MRRIGVEGASPINYDANARRCVLVAGFITLCVMLPLLVAPTLYSSDDWAYDWIFHKDGPGVVEKYLLYTGHPGFGLFLNFLWGFGGADPARRAHMLAILFHLANGWLLWLIFRQVGDGCKFAAILAAFYLVSPFVAGLDFGLSATLFDMVIFCYLLSIWLSASGNMAVIVCAVLAAMLGLSLETLAALEPIRWWYLYQRRPNVVSVSWRASPFVAAILLVGAARVVWFQPEGAYFGYNAVKPINFGEQLHLIWQHLSFFFGAIDAVGYAMALARYDSLAIVLPLLAGAAAIYFIAARAGPNPNFRALALLSASAVFVLLLGMLPYNLIDSMPQRIDNTARFAIVSQFGALILLAVAISFIRIVPLQAGILGIAVLVFATVPLQMAKWLLYEELVLRDFRSQVGEYLARSDEQIVVVQFQPPSSQFLYRHRGCLSSYDINISLEIAGLRHGSWVFDRDCGNWNYLSSKCGFWFGFFQQQCPERRTSAQFVLAPDAKQYDRFRLVDVVRQVLSGVPMHSGQLVPDEHARSSLAHDGSHV